MILDSVISLPFPGPSVSEMEHMLILLLLFHRAPLKPCRLTRQVPLPTEASVAEQNSETLAT